MLKTVAVGTISCIALALVCSSPALAQNYGGYTPGPGPYNPNPYSSPAVSPYINLGVNPTTGLSNYQSLVRPLIDERETMLQQTATLQQLQRQMRQGQSGPASKEPGARPTATHFMHYSHYFGGMR
jgi:hypothetical protein